MECKKCNTQIAEGGTFCPSCGTPVSELQTTGNLENDVVVEQKPQTNLVSTNEVESQNPVSQVEVTPEEYPQVNAKKSENKQKNIIICAGIIAVILVLGFFVLRFFKSSPRDIFNRSIDQVFKTVNQNMENGQKTVTSSISIKPKVTLNDSSYQEISEIINKLNLGLNYGVDTKNKTMNLEMKSSYDNDILVNANMYFNNKKAYVYLPNIYDKYINADMTENDYNKMFEVNKNQEEVKIILNEFKSALKNSLKDEYFKTDSETLIIDGTETKMKKSVLTIDGKRMDEIQKEIVTTLKDNNEFIKAIAKISGEEKSVVKEEIESSLEELEDLSNEASTITISIYTKGLFNDFMGVKVESNSMSMNFIKQSENEWSYEIQTDGSTFISGTVILKENDNKKDITVSAKIPNFGTFELSMTSSTGYNKKVEVPTISNSSVISSNDMSEEEVKEIQNALLQNKGIQKLMQQVQSIMEYGYGSIDYNY